MSAEVIGILGVIVLFVFLALRMWVGAAMCLAGFLGIILIRGDPQALMVIGSTPFVTANNYNLTVIPMFVLMGMVISESGIGSGLFRMANAWIGHRRGGLASATVVASGLLGAITGSHMAGTIIMSKIALPEMRSRGYDDGLATGAIAGGAPLSIIIPPSIPMIMYGIIAEENIGKLFIAGILPGILLIAIYFVIISITTRLRPTWGPRDVKHTFREKLKSLAGVWPMLLLFLLVLGGIYGGLFTTTESGAIGAFGAIIIAFINRTMTWKKLLKCFVDAAYMTGTILLLMIGTYVFISFIAMSKLPFLLSEFVLGLNAPNAVIIIAVMLIYIILGMFLPDNPMVVLTIPILYPVITALGFNGIWFGIFVVLMMALGSITPPVGMVVYLLSGITDVPVQKIFKGVLPFIIGLFLVIILVALFPQIALFLPSLMG